MRQDWAQVLFILLGNAGIWIPLIIWIKGGQEDSSKENRELILAGQAESRIILEAIRQEMKDFHGRLCTLEAKRK